MTWSWEYNYKHVWSSLFLLKEFLNRTYKSKWYVFRVLSEITISVILWISSYWILSVRLKICRLHPLQRAALSAGAVEYADCMLYKEVRTPLLPHPIKGCLGYDRKLHLIMNSLFRSSGACGVPLHCHYFQFHSDPKW